jgi:hypothetical protein
MLDRYATNNSEMGLNQNFKFQFDTAKELEDFLKSFSSDFEVKIFDEYYLITPKEKSSFTFHISIEPFGFRSDRAGEYFRFFGIFLEELTGKFGKVEIDDV